MKGVRAAILACSALSAMFAACGDSERRIDIGAGEADAATTPAAVFSPDSGDANALDAARLDVPMCIATECPAPFATCPTAGPVAAYACGTNLLADRNNCGKCGNVCPSSNAFPELHMDTQCVNGTCQRECVASGSSSFQDCNGVVDDGCETNVTTSTTNCGVCGNVCPPGPDGVARCLNGQCGCPAGQTFCNPVGCVDTSSDDTNCGACGNECQGTDAGPPPPHMVYKCGGGKCAQLQCDKGWANCNGVMSDGCEVDIADDDNNCGACANKCTGGEHCIIRGNVIGCGCEPLETLCTDGSGQQSCVDVLDDPKNCGACGYVCPSQSGYVSSCTKGFCEYACPPGQGDCDGDLRNGCETNLQVDGRHCGSCGNSCDTAAGQPCLSGSCLVGPCDAGAVTK